MASRGLNARVVQKKLHKITKELLNREEIQCLLTDSAETIPAMKFLVEPASIDRYEDDVFTFKRDAEECFKLFSSLRGKKRDYPGLVNFFATLMEDNFPGVFDLAAVETTAPVSVMGSSRKRGRHEVEDPQESVPELKKTPSRTKQAEIETDPALSNEFRLTYNEKNALRAIITKLSKNPLAEPFLHPVDITAYPEYYRVVKRPVDLETVRAQINDYSTLQEALGDLRLIWENCRKFNEEGSDIIVATYTMGDALEEMVEEKFGEEFVVRKKVVKRRVLMDDDGLEDKQKSIAATMTSARKKRVSVGVDSSVATGSQQLLTKGDMKQLLREMAACEFAAPFVDAVDPASAPGYLKVVHTPMAIETVRGHARAGLYEGNAALFVTHMRLISANCLMYNDKNSDISRWAQQFGAVFEENLLRITGGVGFPVATASKGRHVEETSVKQEGADVQLAVDVESGVIRIPRKSLMTGGGKREVQGDSIAEAEEAVIVKTRMILSPTMRKLKKIHKEILHHELSPAFHHPINLAQAPGYSSVVKMPMDLATVKSQLASYEESPGKFLRDMRLIFDNCQLYNQEESALYQAAGTLRSLVDELFIEHFPPQEVQTVKTPGRGGGRVVSKVEEGKGSTKADQGDNGQVSFVRNVSDMPSAYARAAKAPPALPRPQSLADIEELVNQLSDISVNKGQNKFVRDKAFRAAIDLLRSTKLPFVLASPLYEVTRFGDVNPEMPGHDEQHIFPIGYTSVRTLHICVNPSDGLSNPVVKNPFFPVELKSVIVLSDSSDMGCSFVVTLQNGTVVSSGSSPRLAWEGVLDKAHAAALSVASKMERCRCVFNRLCMSPDSTPFLEQVPATGEDGTDYYRVITAPMWLREVHARLLSGTYDNEFDFAWDVRLVFRNCMEYNAPSSALYHTAQRASLTFEHLFVNWVVNVQDRSVEDVAVGAWSDWRHIRYFDSPNSEENICVLTGQRGPESDMVQCQWCEDQYLRSAVQLTGNKLKWACPRCTSAWEMVNANPNGEPLPLLSAKFLEVPFSCEEFGGSVFVPSVDLGTGWCQARRKMRGGLKNTFLSPLGYEVFSREEVVAQDAYETSINQDLFVARAKEYQESLTASIKSVSSSISGTKGKTSTKKSKSVRHTRRTRSVQSTHDDDQQEKHAEEFSSSSSSSSGGDQLSLPVDADEEGRLTLGKLCRFVVPEGARLVWFTCADEAATLETVRKHEDASTLPSFQSELSIVDFAEDGFFGLSQPEIRARIEGLEHVNNCAAYVFQGSDDIAAELLDELEYERDKFSALTDGEARLKRTLLNERWHWEMVRLDPWSLAPEPTAIVVDVVSAGGAMDVEVSSGVVVNASTALHREGFTQLFPDPISTNQADALLSLWDFFDAAKHLMGTPTFTLMDLMRSIEKPSSVLPTFGQVVFDEACCMIAELLLGETRVRADLSAEHERVWQDILMVKPVNIITWPQVALEAIRILSCPFSPVEVQQLVNKPAVTKELTDQNDLLVLLFAHPAVDVFLSSNNTQYVWHSNATKAAVTKTLGVILGVRDSFCRAMGIHVLQEEGETNSPAEIPSTAAVCNQLRTSFLEVLEAVDVDPLFVMAADQLLAWFDNLVGNFGVDVAVEQHHLSNLASSQLFAGSKARSDMNYKRFWGSYLLSNSETPREQVLTPLSFTNYRGLGDYDIKVRALQSMQRALLLLRGAEPETFSADDRVAVYSALVDMGSMAKVLTSGARSKHTRLRNALSEYHEPQITLTTSAPVLQPAKGTTARCHFTGISMRNTFEALQWNAVPPEYAVLPVVLELQAALDKSTSSSTELVKPELFVGDTAPVENDSSNQFRNSRLVDTESSAVGVDPTLIAVQSALLRVMTAREAAAKEKGKYGEYIASQLDALGKPVVPFRSSIEVEGSRPLGYRALPVGFDRHGNSFWVLPAQELMTLFPYGTNGTSAIAASRGVVPMEPCVLLREPGGWWGYHHGHDLQRLVNSLSPEIVCERILKECLVDRISFARRLLLSGTLRIKSAQQEWIDRRIRSERWTSQVRLSEDFSVAQAIRLVEVVWARCVEVRMYIHYSGIYRREEDPSSKTSVRAERDAIARRQKRIRETVQDDTFDHHPIKGWSRIDLLTRLRELGATTTATRIHADSSVYGIVNHNLKHSIYHRREQPLLTAPVPMVMAVTAPDADSASSTVLEHLEVRESVTVPVPHHPQQTEEESHSLLEDMEDFLHLAEVLADPANPCDEKEEKYQSQSMEKQEGEEKMALSAEVHKPVVNKTESNVAMPEEDEEEVRLQRAAENSERYDPEIEAALEMSYNNTKKQMPVEQLHLITGEVLRVYPRGKDAALFMNVSQSGISLCCSGTKADCYGFRWRMYEGPPIDFDAIKDRQTPWEDLKRMQIMRGKHVEFNLEEEQERIRRGFIGTIGTPKKTYNTKNSNIITTIVPVGDDDRVVRNAAKPASETIAHTLAHKTAPVSSQAISQTSVISFVNSNLQSVASTKFQPILTASSVLVSGRMLRLKAELLSMFYIVPEKLFRWPEPTQEGLLSIEAAGAAAADAVFTTAARMAAGEQTVAPATAVDEDDEDAPVNVGGLDLSRANVDKLADKAARKAKRRLKRRMAIDLFVNSVLDAITSTQLMNAVVIFEQALPPSLLFTYPRHMMTVTGHSLAAVAVRIYSIDRALRYDDMKGAEVQSAICTYKLRTQFAPRCLLAASCTRFMCHGGKCSNFTDTASRVPDIFDAPQQQPFAMAAMGNARPLSQQFPAQDRINRYPGMGAGGFMGHSQPLVGTSNNLMNSIGAYRRPFEAHGLTGGQYQLGVGPQYRDEYEMPERERRPEKVIVDIENIQPYVPLAHEVSGVEWL